MPSVLPSHIVAAIDSMFGPCQNETAVHRIRVSYTAEVHALLSMLDQVPPELIDLNARDYLEFNRCKGALATALALWNVGGVQPVKEVGGKDAVERVRRLMLQCHDEVPPAEPELPFIADDDIRLGIEDRIRAAWTDFYAREWMGATVLAGHVIEAMLLWALKQHKGGAALKKPPDALVLHDMIAEAAARSIITPQTQQHAQLAKDARNLIHPGKASRSSTTCSKATALTALAALYRVADDLKATAGTSDDAAGARDPR